MTTLSWEAYPSTYRADVVDRIFRATAAGECAAIIGLSGAGKSNVAGFIATSASRAGADANQRYILIDCNRLPEPTPNLLFRAMRRALLLEDISPVIDEFEALDVSLNAILTGDTQVTFLLDRFDDVANGADRVLFNRLRSLRDHHKYKLTYVTFTRRVLDDRTELAELFFANTLWLGPMSDADARWNVARYAARYRQKWAENVVEQLLAVSGRYPSLLRACADAYAAGGVLDIDTLARHPAVQRRVNEFWADQPTPQEMTASGLDNHPLLMRGRTPVFDTSQLTAKEHALLAFLQVRAGQVCEKDEIIRAVWPEDKVVERGIRDDSLAQLVRRLREKIEPNSAAPRYILTVPGRGYRFVQK